MTGLIVIGMVLIAIWVIAAILEVIVTAILPVIGNIIIAVALWKATKLLWNWYKDQKNQKTVA